MCEQIWTEASIPEEWTKSILVTIPKKGDLSECENYKIYFKKLHGKKNVIDTAEQTEGASGEYIDRRTEQIEALYSVQPILTLRFVTEKAKMKNKNVYNCLIDFQKAFDSVN